MRINWKKQYSENLKFKEETFPNMRFKIFFNVLHSIRLFFRITFSKRWRTIIKLNKPEWVKRAKVK